MDVIKNADTESGDRRTEPAPNRRRLAQLTAGLVLAGGAVVVAAAPGWAFPGLGC